MVWWPKRKTNARSSNVSLVSKDVKTCVDWDFNFYNAGYSSYSLLTPSLFSLTSHVVFKKTLLQSISHLRPSSISFSAEAVAFSDEATVSSAVCSNRLRGIYLPTSLFQTASDPTYPCEAAVHGGALGTWFAVMDESFFFFFFNWKDARVVERCRQAAKCSD